MRQVWDREALAWISVPEAKRFDEATGQWYLATSDGYPDRESPTSAPRHDSEEEFDAWLHDPRGNTINEMRNQHAEARRKLKSKGGR